MASKNREKLSVVFGANESELNEEGKLERLELIKRIHILNNGREVKTLKNKKILGNIVKNLPGNCPECSSDFSRDNFYLIEIFDGAGAEVSIDCLNGDYRDVVSKYNE